MTKRRQSIQYKIWLAIMVTVIIAIGTLWIMQVVFLEYYYVMIKKANLQKDAFTVAKTISKNGITESVEDIMKLASEKTLCVDISTIDGINIFSVEGLGDNCFVHNNLDKKSTIFLETINNEGRFVVTEVSHPKYNTQFLISSAVITAKHGSKCVIMVTTTLAPITEAVSIIQTQLIYVTVILVLISLIISFIIARSITKPLRKISNAAKNIAKGNFDVDVSVDTQDELKDLSDSFNHMTKELSKVNILQKELIANISHDIRTPLTMIKGYAESIKDITGDNKEVRDNQLEIIMEESDRLNTLVNDVMDLSLLQAGQKKLELRSFCINKKIEDILLRFNLLVQNDGFNFNINNHFGRDVFVLADEVRIEQVLYNLINNAVNHIGEVKNITISLVQDGQEVRVEVNDTGTGIPQEEIPHIWDRYYKSFKKAGGTGLGLSIVKAILINHKSRFGVYSTLNVGSTFWFTLQMYIE